MAAAKRKKNIIAAKETVPANEATAPAEVLDTGITVPENNAAAAPVAGPETPATAEVMPEGEQVSDSVEAVSAEEGQTAPLPEETESVQPEAEQAPAEESDIQNKNNSEDPVEPVIAENVSEINGEEEPPKNAEEAEATVESDAEASEQPAEPADEVKPDEPETTEAVETTQSEKSKTAPAKEKTTEPVAAKRVIKSSAQYSKSAEREKNIRKQVKKRKRRPVLLVLFLCSMLVLVAIVYNSITQEPEMPPEPTPSPEVINTPQPAEIIVPTLPPGVEPIGETEGPGEENPEEITPEPEPVEHSYQLFVEDVSWEEAKERCLNIGGYLAVISSSDELEEIIEMAENNGVTHVWLGCHRENGELVWEREGEYYYQWDRGEPSGYDSGDNVAEDYLMFWEHNGAWYYNDSRNDPCADYPYIYSGDMAYVCEFGSN